MSGVVKTWMVGLPVLQPLSPRQDCRIRFAAFVCKYSMIFRCSLNQQNLFILSQRKQKTFGQRKNTQPCLHASAGRKRSLNLTVSLAFLAFFPLAELPLELQLVGEERLSPAHILSQGPHVRGDVVTGGLNYRLPQFVREAQLWGGKARSGSRHTWVQGKSVAHSRNHYPTPAAREILEETLCVQHSSCLRKCPL